MPKPPFRIPTVFELRLWSCHARDRREACNIESDALDFVKKLLGDLTEEQLLEERATATFRVRHEFSDHDREVLHRIEQLLQAETEEEENKFGFKCVSPGPKQDIGRYPDGYPKEITVSWESDVDLK